MAFSKGKKEVTYVFILFLVSKIFSYLLLLVFANLYAPKEYGAASFVYALFNIALIFTCMGLPDTLVPFILRKKDTSSVFYFLGLINLLIFAGSVIVSLYHPWILPLVILLPFVLFDNFSKAILKSDYRYHISQIASTSFVSLAVLLAFFLKDFQKIGIILAYSISYFIPTVYLFFKTRKQIWDIISRFRIRIKPVREYLKNGMVYALITASFSFLTWIDSSVLGVLSTFENVASYTVAGAIANVVAAIPLSIYHFTIVRSASLRSERKSRLVLMRTIRVSYFFSLMLAMLLNSLLYFIIKIFFPKYVGINIFVAILSVGLVFYSLYFMINAFLIGKMSQQKTIVPILAAASINFVLDIVLIPYYGLYGITAATLIAHTVAMIMLSRKMGVKISKFLVIPPLFITASYILGIYGLILTPVLLYVMFMLKMIVKEDLLVIKDTLVRVIRRS